MPPADEADGTRLNAEDAKNAEKDRDRGKATANGKAERVKANDTAFKAGLS